MPDEVRTEGRAQPPAVIIRQNLDRMEPEFRMALPSHIPVERFKRVALTAVNQSPELLKAEPRALMAACIRAAQDGLLPDGREGAIVVFKGRPQWMPMVYGIIKKMRQSGDVKSITARCVFEKDTFTYVMGDSEKLEHTPCLDDDPGKLRLVYAVAHLDNGEIVREVMTRKQIDKIKAVSPSGDRGPWGAWYDEMARKSAVRRLAKYLPQSSEVERMWQRDDEHMRAIDARPAAAPPPPQIAAPVAEIEQGQAEADAFEHAADGVTDVVDAETQPADNQTTAPAPAAEPPASPLSLKASVREAAWPAFTAWMLDQIRTLPVGEIEGLLKNRCGKEWAFIVQHRTADYDAITAAWDARGN